MASLDTDPDIIQLADRIGTGDDSSPVAKILKWCSTEAARLLSSHGEVRTLDDLQDIIAKEFRLEFEEIHMDSDFDRVTEKYASQGDFAVAGAKEQLAGDEFALLIRRCATDGNGNTRYIALIDCRGEKRQRRYFTRWHELAHVLTGVTDLRQGRSSEDPLERLMDMVAGEIGFFAAILLPALNDELSTSGNLSFSGIDRIKSLICPTASFHALLIACVRHSQIPSIIVEARMALKAEEQRIIDDPQHELFPRPKPVPKLRAVGASPNSAAKRAKLNIHKNMSIPRGSVIHKHFSAEDLIDLPSATCCVDDEDFAIWRTSDGTPVGFGTIRVEVKRNGDGVLALIQRPVTVTRKPPLRRLYSHGQKLGG